MANKTGSSKKGVLLQLAEERALSKKEIDDEKRKHQESLVPYMPKDCVSIILVRLPVQSLQSSRFVCKPWYNIVNSSLFIDAHLRRSKFVIIFLESAVIERSNFYVGPQILQENLNTFWVEANLRRSGSIPVLHQPDLDPRSKHYLKFIEFEDGKGKFKEFNASCLGNIRATCNGLILIDNKFKKGGLIVFNPVTRKLVALPLGTLYPPHDESYGFGLCNVTGKYKVVHLFRDELGYVSCEILTPGASSWREVNGPSFGLFGWFGYKPISAIGALHWIPQIDRSECLVSIELHTEKFHTIPLPEHSRAHDGIIEMKGFLCFIVHQEICQRMDVWVLKSLQGEDWTTYHSITIGYIIDLVPFCSTSRDDEEIIFRRDEDCSFYTYNLRFEGMRKIEFEIRKGNESLRRSRSCLPHVNSLVSWDIGGAEQDQFDV
ncbi:F-box associated domain, type 3 [Dillenia turbinata]|uniref:F-box associated domain, type 3 n=1 Tax=Dillenia turbinata TaxID=194707 RepID=A0AAN8Z993_9MAGN